LVDISTYLNSNQVRRLGVEPPVEGGMRKWLDNEAYVPEVDIATGAMRITNFEPRSLVPYLSEDYQRFALSSAESFLTAKVEFDKHKLLGWPLLKLYYSAFFAAHALMRSQGAGVIKLEKSQTKKINNFLSIAGDAERKVSPGMYLFQSDTTKIGGPEVLFSEHGKGSGVHEAFWKTFCDHLHSLSMDALGAGAVDANAMSTGSEELCQAITGTSDRSGSWISMMRNQINYQHQHSVWFPTARAGKIMDQLSGLQVAPSRNAFLSPSIGKEPLKLFVEITNTLSLLNFEVAEFVAARSTKGGAFGQKWRRLMGLIA
jgi:hypothetical protein